MLLPLAATISLPDNSDSWHLLRLLTGQQRAQVRRALLADAGYANGPNYTFLEAWHVPAWLPAFGQNKLKTQGFPHDRRTDAYACAVGNALSFHRSDVMTNGNWVKLWWAAYRDCHPCTH